MSSSQKVGNYKILLAGVAAFICCILPVQAKNHPDSKLLEKGLQTLPWERFRSAIEGVPKLKAEFDSNGSGGWQVIQTRVRVVIHLSVKVAQAAIPGPRDLSLSRGPFLIQ
jgi:hypothetical protein